LANNQYFLGRACSPNTPLFCGLIGDQFLPFTRRLGFSDGKRLVYF
jgi:hypothetical protein